MGRELEWKYAASAAVLDVLQGKFGPFLSVSMETTYYDTFDLKLAMHHWTLRQRMENGVSVCTFKRPLEDGSRGEWEVEAPNIMDGILKLYEAGAPAELVRITAGGVIPTCGARFTRLAAEITLPECTVELALDSGILHGRNREIPLCEVEVEYKSGSEAAARDFARELAQTHGLQAEPKSKFVRAMTLALT